MDEYQFYVMKKKNGQIDELVFEGELTLSNVEELKEKLSAVDCSSLEKIKLNLGKVDEVDLAFLQLFKSFVGFMEKHQVGVEVDPPKNEDLILLLERAGFSKVFNLI